MKIHFESSGGITGMRFLVDLDTNLLTSQEAGQIENLVNKSGFFELPPRPNEFQKGTDYRTYKIKIETPQQMHDIEVTDQSLSDELANLVDYLEEKAQPVKS